MYLILVGCMYVVMYMLVSLCMRMSTHMYNRCRCVKLSTKLTLHAVPCTPDGAEDRKLITQCAY